MSTKGWFFFLWLAFQNKILTQDRLQKFGISGPSRHILCKEDVESAEHILYKCPFAQLCWDWLVNKMEWSSPFPKMFVDFLKSWPINSNKGVYRNCGIYVPPF